MEMNPAAPPRPADPPPHPSPAHDDPLRADRHERCLNCQAPLHGQYCHVCGQKDGPVAVPPGPFAVEAFEEVFSIDRRFFRTLWMLAARPGALTREWIAGRRVRHVPPFRLYLTASVVYFLVLAVSRDASFFFFTAGTGPQARAFIALLPRLMFFILPLFALLLGVLFGRRFFVAHLVFALHFFALAFLLLSAHTLLEAGVFAALARRQVALARAGMLVDSALQLALFVYLYLALRRVYELGRGGTVLRLVALMGGYLGILVLAAQAIIAAMQRLGRFG